MQTYDINSQDRPIDSTDHQRNCVVTATATDTGSMMTAGPRQSFVSGLCVHYVEGRKAMPARSSDAGDAVIASVLLFLAMFCR